MVDYAYPEKNMHKTVLKKATIYAIAMILVFSVSFFTVGCKNFPYGKNNSYQEFASVSARDESGSPSLGPKQVRLTPEEDKIAVFTYGGAEGFYASRNYSNGYPFNCVWRKNNVVFENGVMSLKLTYNGKYYESGEYRSSNYYRYGYYSVCMKAAACSGVISSFFTYTGRPWDEIDMEFLGNETTKMQFNYYTGGMGGHEYLCDLGFDGADDFHEYGFDWQPDRIEWYVDGNHVYTATVDIPSAASQIMVNVWTGTGDTFIKWCGQFDDKKLPVAAQYKWIGFKAAN